ncbi:MAG: WecB/TagA/CpsF family glycosyltransferase [Candidatus Bipolaricaulota bacterium]
MIAYVNAHAVNLAHDLPWFREFLDSCDVVYCDGFGVSLAAWLLGQKVPPRHTPPDWIGDLCKRAEAEGLSMFMLGASPGVADKAADRLREHAPGLKIAGIHHGYFNKVRDGSENLAVVRAINLARPNILLVGFGMPLQEQWILQNREELRVGAILTVGALFDHLAGEVKRAPRWMTDRGLEWLGRLVIEPRRLWRRYLLGNPRFLMRVMAHRIGLRRHS